MLLMGDEVRRTQQGNNNAYCQDNEISWFDWRGPAQHADIHRFACLLLMLRSRRDLARVGKNMTLNQILHHARITWHGIKFDQSDWSDDSHSLAVMCLTLDGRFLIHFIVNAYWQPPIFQLPHGLHQGWHRLIDTYLQ